MRTTIEVPDALFRKTKAKAALKGSSMKDLIIRAIEREVNLSDAKPVARPKRIQVPLLKMKGTTPLDLDHFDFEDLLA